jgi:hypothetical protein
MVADRPTMRTVRRRTGGPPCTGVSVFRCAPLRGAFEVDDQAGRRDDSMSTTRVVGSSIVSLQCLAGARARPAAVRLAVRGVHQLGEEDPA